MMHAILLLLFERFLHLLQLAAQHAHLTVCIRNTFSINAGLLCHLLNGGSLLVHRPSSLLEGSLESILGSIRRLCYGQHF